MFVISVRYVERQWQTIRNNVMHLLHSTERIKNGEREDEDLRNWLLDQPEGLVTAEELCLTL